MCVDRRQVYGGGGGGGWRGYGVGQAKGGLQWWGMDEWVGEGGVGAGSSGWLGGKFMLR